VKEETTTKKDINSHLRGLNDAQKEAVLKLDGPLLILAGAGAGKTKTITHRILNLIKSGTNPSNILAITFTNKAAKEMRERVEKLLTEDRDVNLPISIYERPFLSTFHALGVHIIRENHTLLGLPRHFAIYDRSESLSSIKNAVKDAGYDPKQFEPSKYLSIISKRKGDGVNLNQFENEDRSSFTDKILFDIWTRYERDLRENKALDFDDLLLKTFTLLKNNNEVLKKYQDMWKYIHIDEYQDTNRIQYDLAKLLAEKTKNICAVGDIDQSIYSWRGADFKNIMRFEKDYPDTKVILLEENYRSTKNILKAANAVISKNTLRKEKNLFTSNEDGEKITVYGAYDEADEARFVSEKSRSLINKGTKASEIAVLYRANFQSRALEEAFLEKSVPYQVLGTRFFERKEVKDVISYLRASLDRESLSDLKRIINTPTRGIGKTTIAKVFAKEKITDSTKEKVDSFYRLLDKIENFSKTNSLSETIIFIIKESGMERAYKDGKDEDLERLENIMELASVATKYDLLPKEDALEKFLTETALYSDQDDMEKNENGVRLLTVHSAKGLEFEYVFVTGMEEDLFPHGGFSESKKNLEQSEEERRLFYVAITRAKKKLFLTHTAVRTIFGRKQVNIPSQFLEDIEEELLEGEVNTGEHRGKVIYLE
jgi:DNA helicase-2/ATP-dependent DNA helicase PcrA